MSSTEGAAAPSDSFSPEAWAEATATTTLNMSEMDALVRKSQEQWDEYEKQKKLSTELHNKYEETEAAIMAALKAAGKTKYHVDGVGTVSIVQKASVLTPKTIEDKEKLFQYLRSKGKEVLYSLATVNSQTLNAWYQRELDDAAAKGILGFSVPGVGESVMRESMRFNTETKKGKSNG